MMTRRGLLGLLGKAVLAASLPINALCGFLPEPVPEKPEPAYQFGFTGWKEMETSVPFHFSGNLVITAPRMMFEVTGVKP